MNIPQNFLHAPRLTTKEFVCSEHKIVHSESRKDAHLLTVRNLNVTYPVRQGVFHAVRDLNLTLQTGQTLALVGESGCGKSTTALALMRLLPGQAKLNGHIYFEGVDLLSQSEAAMRRLRGNTVSMIFQEPMTSLNPVYTIGTQIAESLRLHMGLSKRAARKRSIELLDLVRIPEPHLRVDDYPHQLSGGQRQRAMIAMAVSCQPRLLIADEPTTALDVTVQAQILKLLDDLRREFSMALLIITHDLGVVSKWADHVAVMYGGRVVESGTTSCVLGNAQHAYTRGLLGVSLHSSGKTHYTQGALPEIKINLQTETDKAQISKSSNHETFEVTTRTLVPRSSSPESGTGVQPDRHDDARYNPAILSVSDLHCEYHQAGKVVQAVNGVSFEIRHGQTLGLVGESGCGKSTLSKALLRLLQPKSGQIVLNGEDISQLPERALRPHRAHIQMVFQDPYASLNPRHTVSDTLDTTLRVHGIKDRQERACRIRQILDDVGLPASAAQRYPNEFSGGQRQRIGIARALILKPALVVCDEPVSALDVSIQAQILNLLVGLKNEYNLSYLFISHDLAVVRYIADAVMVMRCGSIVEKGDPQKIWQHPQHSYTRELLASIPSMASFN